MYASIKPSAYTDLYDVYQYTYYKPMSKEEFIYFNLTKDYETGNTAAYSGISGETFWPQFTVRLDDTAKTYFLDVIHKMNPDYQSEEKMNDVVLNMDAEEVKPYLEELEKKLDIASFYYTGMYASETYNEEYDMVDSPSPYWIYLKSGKQIFSEEEYARHRKDFELSYKQGISKGYARVALDYTGILIGILSVVYSFQSYADDKRADSNGFIYTEKISAARHVTGKYFATCIPLMLLSFCYMLFAAGCFWHWNDVFAYGYQVDVFTFLGQVPLVLFPTVCIIVAVSQLLGILVQSEIITAVFQFVFFYLSMSGVPDHRLSLNMVIRYNNFDDYSFYQTYLKYVPANRFLMAVSSAVLVCFVTVLFAYRKGQGELISWDRVKKFAIVFQRDNRKPEVARCLPFYISRHSVHRSAFLYIPYLCLMYPIVITKNMDALTIATVGENIIIFASLFLFIRLGNMEKADGMEDQVFTAATSYPLVYMARVCMAACVLFVLVEVPLGVLCICNAVPVGRWCAGVYLSSMFLGVLSLLVAEVSENSFVGYFVYIIYYFLDAVLRYGMVIPLSGYTKRMRQTETIPCHSNSVAFGGFGGVCIFKNERNKAGV